MIRRRAKDKGFTQVDNAMLLNVSLSLKAKGLLTIMMSRKEDWVFYMSWLEQQSSDGREAHRSAMSELIEAGYVERKRKNGEDGKLIWEYIVDDVPHAKSTIDGFTVHGSTVHGKPASSNTDSINTDFSNTYSSCDDSPSAHHAASQPQPSIQKDHPEERVWDEQTLPSGQSPGDGGSDGDDSKENSPPAPPLSVTKRTRDESKITDADNRQAAYVQRLSDYIGLKVDGHEMSGVHIQAIWDKYEWWYMTGAAGVEREVLEYAASEGVDMKPFFANERRIDFQAGTDPHPAPQTHLPDDPGARTGHSHPDPLAASLAALNPSILQEMALKKMEADKARRKTYAVRNAIEDGTLRAIHELCPQGYEIVLSALRDFAMKPEKMLEWFRKKPNVPRAINTLKKPEYITLRDAAREKAAGFSEGWQQYPALHFFDLVVNGSKASGPKERPMHMKDEPRYHYQNEIQAAKTYEEILAVITKYDEQGLWPQTPRKIKQDGRWTVMRDEKGALVMATPEEHARDRIAQKEW